MSGHRTATIGGTRARSALGASRRWAGARPFTIGLAALLVIAGVVARSVVGTPSAMRAALGTGFEPVVEQGRWWTLATSTIVPRNAPDLVLALILVIALIGIAERVMGTWRTAIAFVVSAIIGPVVGLGLQFLGNLTGEFWSRHVTELVVLDPVTAIAGTLMAASSFTSTLWRRRIRILTLLVALIFLLYSGQPADLYRLLAALAGVPLGRILRSDAPPRGWVRSSAHESRVLLAATVAITALGPAIALATGSRLGPLAPVTLLLGNQVPDAAQSLARCRAFTVTTGCVRDLTLERIDNPGALLVSVTPLILLLVASFGLLRGRRFAVWLAAAVNGLLGILDAYYFGLLPVAGVPYVLPHPTAATWETGFGLAMSAVLPLTIAVGLILLRSRFPVLASQRSIGRYVVLVAASAVGLAVVYVVGGLLVRDTAFTTSVSLADLLGDVVERFIPVSFLKPETIAFLPSTVIGRLLYYGIGPVFWLIVILGAVSPLRDTPAREQPGALTRVRSMLKVGGGDSLAFMAGWPGNSYWFDSAQSLAVAYRLVGRIAITLGAPFGSPESKDAALGRFARFCDDNEWVPVFYSIDGSFEPVFESMGWHTMVVAEETVVRPATFQTTGKKWQDVRSSINRAERAGITATWTSYGALPLATAVQLAEISEQWVADKDLPEMGFTLGGLDQLRDPAVRLMLALDADGRVQGITSWLPSYRDGAVVGWTLDFMRRRTDSINGVMEFLIAQAAVTMQRDGIETLSLSAAPLAHTAGLDEDASSIDRMLGYLSSALEPVYGFRSLLKFKKKFQPEHHPLLLAYPDPAALPAIGLALTRAYLPTLTVGHAIRLVRSPG